MQYLWDGKPPDALESKGIFARECWYQCDVLKPKPQAPNAPASIIVGFGMLHLEGPAAHVEGAVNVDGTCREKSHRLPLGACRCLSLSLPTDPEFLDLALLALRAGSEVLLHSLLQRMLCRNDMSRSFVYCSTDLTCKRSVNGLTLRSNSRVGLNPTRDLQLKGIVRTVQPEGSTTREFRVRG